MPRGPAARGRSSTKTPSCESRFRTSSAACSICARPWWRSATSSARKPSASPASRGKSSARTRSRQSGRATSSASGSSGNDSRAARPARRAARRGGAAGARGRSSRAPAPRRAAGPSCLQRRLQRGAELVLAGEQPLDLRGETLGCRPSAASIARRISWGEAGPWFSSASRVPSSAPISGGTRSASAATTARWRSSSSASHAASADQDQRQHEGDQEEQPVEEAWRRPGRRPRRRRSRWRSRDQHDPDQRRQQPRAADARHRPKPVAECGRGGRKPNARSVCARSRGPHTKLTARIS